MAHFGSCIWLAVSQMTSVHRLISVFVWSRWVISESYSGEEVIWWGVPLYGQETRASCQPRPSRPRASPATSPPWMGHSDMSISTVSIASHNMHGAHTPLTSTILLQGSPNGANSNPEGYIWYLGNISKQIICPEI